jgi:HEAT repeat protein
MRGKLAFVAAVLVLTISWGVSVGAVFGRPAPRFRHPGFRYPDFYWSRPYINGQWYYFPALPPAPPYDWWEERADVGRGGWETRQEVRDLIHVLRFGTSSERERAARELGRLPFDEVVNALSESLLRDPESDVRREAARSLGRIGADEARPALRYAARDDPSRSVREAAEDALAKLPPEPYLPPLRREFGPSRELERLLVRLNSGSKDDRKDAAKKLGDRKDPQAIAALTVALANDPEEDVRKEAAKALGHIGDPSALPALRWSAVHDREKDVRKEAAKAIDKILD